MSQEQTAMAVGILNSGLKRWVEEQEEPPTPHEILKKAFELSFDETYTWFYTKDQLNERFVTACAAAHTHFDEEFKGILEGELKILRALNSASSGLSVDISSVIEEVGEVEESKHLKANSTFLDMAKKNGSFS